MAGPLYDDPDFFAGYSLLPRSRLGLDGAPEWPTLRRMVGEVTGDAIADLGCGFGWFCRWALDQGAQRVTGYDVSERMLARAREDNRRADISYELVDLDELELPERELDLVYSSLTLHYLDDLPRLFATIRQALRDGGRFVFSAEHPLFTAPSRPAMAEIDGRRVWPVDDYLVEGPRTTDWMVPGVIKQHRTIGTYVGDLVAAGFSIDALVEWGPSDDQLATHPEWLEHRHRPMFLLIACH